jgi:nucleoside-diphosphate-sugar epimerase
MRVLVAGATGEMGRHLLPLLIAGGHEVIGLTRNPGALEGSGATELVADVLEREKFLAAVAGLKCDAVIHQLTPLTKTPTGYGHMSETNRLRWEGTSTLVAAAKLMGAAKMVAASSVYGYGFQNHHNRVLDEDSAFGLLPGNRLDPVLKALRSSEQQTLAFGGVVLRYGLFYSARGPLPVVASDWHGELPFVHIEDAAAATVLALETAPLGSTFNIVDDTPVSWRDLHCARADAFDLPDPMQLPSWVLRSAAPFGSRLISQTSMWVSNARARTELRWEPRYPSYIDALAEARALSEHAQAVATGRAEPVRA